MEDTTINGLVDGVLDILENKLTKELVSQLFALIIVCPFGVLESEAIDQILLIGGVNDLEKATQLWLHLCWIIGPFLLHTNSTYVMDKLIAKAAERRYPSEIATAQRKARDYYEAQPSVLTDAGRKYSETNYRKFALLPRLTYAAAEEDSKFVSSPYLTDLDWISQKVLICGAGSLLNDLRTVDDDQAHVAVLKQMCEKNYLALNYDGKQLFGLLKSNLCASDCKNSVTAQWQERLNEMTTLCLEEIPTQGGQGVVVAGDEETVKYDKIVTLSRSHGYFVVSISTARGELTVWDVVNCKKVRTLTKVPQPTDLCPVGDFGVAVLCGREIKVLDLNDGCFKVTLKGVMNHKMPYFGLHDAGHLVCLSRNRMYVNLMNLESGDCVTTFKAGEDRFLNSLLVSGDGR